MHENGISDFQLNVFNLRPAACESRRPVSKNIKNLKRMNKAIETKNENIEKPEKDIWKMFRKGDGCVVNKDGVRMRGFVSAVIRLSRGINLIRVCNASDIAIGLYTTDEVSASDAEGIYRRENSFENLLKSLEPKGQSTLTM